jgi:diguanylate cyclase (GGDEF)-like protein/PAS domain S-box-containing protein
VSDRETPVGTGAPGGAGALTAFSRRWAAALIDTSHVPLPRIEVEDMIQDLTGALVDMLGAERFQPEQATAAGERLVAEYFTGPTALGDSLRIIGRELLAASGLPDDDRHRLRMADLIGGLTNGYVEASRDKLLDEQEMIKQAVLRARDAEQRRRRASDIRATTIFAQAPVGFVDIGLDGLIQGVNPGMFRIFGYSDGDLAGRPLADLLTPDETAQVLAAFAAVVGGRQEQYSGNVNIIDHNGDKSLTKLSIMLVRDEDDEPNYLIASLEDVSDLQLLRENQLTHELVDKLTGLPNRTRFMSWLDSTLSNARPGDRVALCYIDLDGFKIVNDGVGYGIGDQVLCRVAATLKEIFPGPAAFVARMGGDGFAVLVTSTTSGFEVSERITAVLNELAEPVYYDGETGVAVSASVGIVEREANGITSEDLVRSAELTVHRAKAGGKAQWVPFDPTLDVEDRSNYELGAAIPGALENGEFTVSFQPVLRLIDRELVALRTALHWNHPKRGRLRPKEFLGLAEETGFMMPVATWVLEEVCRMLKDWQDRFGDATPKIGVTMAPRVAREQDLIKIVLSVIGAAAVDTSDLRLGVPSLVVVDEFGETLENLDALNDVGVQTVLENFGTGNAGLVDLHRLPVDGITIDANVIRAFGETPEPGSPFERALTELVRLSKSLHLDLVAEGVDSDELAARLVDIGIPYGYGRALGRPAAPAEIERMISAKAG